MPKLYKSNARGQISLGKLIEPNQYFMASVDEDGRISLVPVLVKPLTDLTRGIDDQQR